MFLLLLLQAVGLPVCLSDLHLDPHDSDKLNIVAAACVAKGNLCLNMPMQLTAEAIRDAVLKTDAAGSTAKAAAAAAAAAAADTRGEAGI
jgi:glycerol dehydrogenase-like iron-containing ADH family enzyme